MVGQLAGAHYGASSLPADWRAGLARGAEIEALADRLFDAAGHARGRLMAKQKFRILVLVHETLVPPDSLDGVGEQAAAEYRTEYDVVSCLRESGHDVRPIGIGDSLTELRTVIHDWQPQVCFNLLEEFGGIVTYDQHVVAYLELLRQSYTGCNPRGMMLSRDKVLSKQILRVSPDSDAALRGIQAGRRDPDPEGAAVSAFRQVGDRGCLARNLAGVDRRGRGAAPRADRIHPPAHRIGCAGRGIHRGSRAVRRRARQ